MRAPHDATVFLLPGDTVEVRPWEEIRATLDANGMLDGLPFMPEMKPLCGRRFVVSRRIERTCEEIHKQMRRIRNAVYLDDLRCDGSGHGGCQKGCFLIWKEAWLRRAGAGATSVGVLRADDREVFPYPYASPGGRYVCQSTELADATSFLPWWDAGMVLRDVKARTYSPGQLLRVIAAALLARLRSLATGRSYRYLEGARAKTPARALHLQAGEWVRVRTREEIAGTLDASGRNRGLTFTVEMLPFCGGTYRVLRRLERMIQESTHTLIEVQDTVILEGVVCTGSHILRGGCPRANYHYWREIWLERVAGDAESS